MTKVLVFSSQENRKVMLRGGSEYSGPKVQSCLFSTPLFSQTNGAEKRTNGAEKRTNGEEKRTNGEEKRTNGTE